ncbi:MAG: ribonuclease III [Paludibacteraceae bacterium]|nr:ribonuclease III [Prevotellaceae bacterium]
MQSNNLVKKIIERLRLLTKNRKEPYLLLYPILGFLPKNIKYYELALLHKSSAVKAKDGHYLNNERLEFLGDAILDAVVADILYRRFTGRREGFLTNTRSKVVQRETLNRVAVEIGLDRLMVFSNHKNHTHNINIYGNAFEALVGAIYLDYGYEKCKWFMEEMVLGKCLDLNKLANREVNFKSKLIEWSQKYKASLVFDLIEESIDEENNPVFQTQIIINGIRAGEGVGYSKKESQQNAAKKALKSVGKDKSVYLKDKVIDDSGEIPSSQITSDSLDLQGDGL